MAQALQIPQQIGRYQIVSEIGRGAMGRVYLATDPVIERQVALKIMAPQVDMSDGEWREAQERFLLEARAAGRLKHPGVVTIFDADLDSPSGTAYIAMELVAGQSLHELLAASAPLQPERAIPIVEQVALALHAAHECDLVHRDVKPANILISDDGTVKLTDFGITKFRTHNLTAAGTVLGSPSYMSPEQLRGETIDGRADLFSLGVVLYECLTGKLPFAGDSIATVTYKILEVDPLDESSQSGTLDGEIVDVVRRAISKDPQERFQNGYELAQALRGANIDSPTPRGPRGTQMLAAGSVGQARLRTEKMAARSAPERSRSPRTLAWLLGLVVVVALAVGIPSYRQPTEPVDLPSQVPSSERLSPGGKADTVIDKLEDAVVTPVEVEESVVPQTERDAAAAISNASLSIRYKNRLKAGHISVWIDGEHVWSRALNLRGGVFKRTSGQVLEGEIPVSVGKHSIEVRITGAERKVDIAKHIEGVFQENDHRVLQIGLIPAVRKMNLSWKE